MNDVNSISMLRDLIDHYKQEAVEILRYSYTDDEIKELCSRFINVDENADLQNELDGEGLTHGTCLTVKSLCYLMYLDRNIPPDDTFVVPGSFVANLVLVGMGAGMLLIEAGWKPSESFSLTRLAQVRNQPKTRKRKLNEKNNIFEMLEIYEYEKGHQPDNFSIFLNYLNANGYVVDNVDQTVDAPKGSELNWKKPFAFGTIDNWRREYKINIDS